MVASQACALRGRARDLGVAEDVRVAADHLGGDALGHRLEIEAAGLLRHLRVVDDLQQQVAELALELRHVAAPDRIGDLVGLLDRVGRDRGEVLLEVPGAAAVRVAQPRHHREQALDAACRSQQPALRRGGTLAAASAWRPRRPTHGAHATVLELELQQAGAARALGIAHQRRLLVAHQREAALQHALVADAREPAGAAPRAAPPPRAGGVAAAWLWRAASPSSTLAMAREAALRPHPA